MSLGRFMCAAVGVMWRIYGVSILGLIQGDTKSLEYSSCLDVILACYL